MATQKLTGRNTYTYTVDLGNIISGDGETPLVAGVYLAKTVATDTGLPTGQKPGRVFESDGTIIPETGDSVYKLTLNDRCDFTSLTSEFTYDELESTTQCDAVKTYLLGLPDASISVEGVVTAGLSEDLIAKFLPIVKQSADFASVENIEADPAPIIFYTELTKKANPKAPKMALVFAGVLTNFNLGGSADSMQTFSSTVRVVSDDNVSIHVYELERV